MLPMSTIVYPTITHTENQIPIPQERICPFNALEKTLAPKGILSFLSKPIANAFTSYHPFFDKDRFSDIRAKTPQYAPTTFYPRPGFYFHANVILGKYIASQAPIVEKPMKSSTIDEFWAVVFAKPSAVFNLTMPLKDRCENYWTLKEEKVLKIPSLAGRDFFSLSEEIIGKVCQVSEEVIFTSKFTGNEPAQNIVKRRFDFFLPNKEIPGTFQTVACRSINHYHCENWPDGRVPAMDTCKKLVELLDAEMPLPFIHCSAGIGRTGVIIAIHYLFKEVQKLIDQGQSAVMVDPLSVINEMRKDRDLMVENEIQLQFIYDCVHEHALQYKNSKEPSKD